MELLDLNKAYAGLTDTTTTACSTLGNVGYGLGYCYPTHYDICCHWGEDKGKKAFAIVKELQKKKLIALKTVPEFIEVMDTILSLL